jgi:uncharacterized HAD superfamily protein
MIRLGVDLDNTLLEWQYHWADLYGQWFGRTIPVKDLGSWNACLDLTHFTTMNEFYDWFDRANGWDTQPYVKGAAGALYMFEQAGIQFQFVTARPRVGGVAARRWAAQEWPGHPVNVLGNQDKHNAPADLWIDDSPDVLTSLVRHGKRAVRFDRPWNRDLDKGTESRVLAAKTWTDVVDIVTDLKGQYT